MRVTAETQAATRERILEVAQRLFTAQGFDATTTRDIARDAEIGVGTLFNYFRTKEAVLVSLAMESVVSAHEEFARDALHGDSLEEELFAFVAAELRKLKPLRKHVPVIVETALSPLAAGADDDGQWLRVAHLEAVSRFSHRHGFKEHSAVSLQIYWSLYTGLLLFWANDKSPRQEDTLALLDHSLEMFVGWLNAQPENSFAKPQKSKE
jgi:AcrR family transcriptional regulator